MQTEAVRKLQAGRYPPARWAGAAATTSELWLRGNQNPLPRTRRLAAELYETALKGLPSVLADKSVPERELVALSMDIIAAGALVEGDRRKAFEKIHPEFVKAFPGGAMPHQLRGLFFVKYAWDGRGRGWAKDVKDEGWKLFAERLEQAEKSLEEAWRLDPADPEIAAAMITVELGQGRGRERMEMWFRRAMEIDPDNFEACGNKLTYLQPRWHGSAEEMIAFGRECVRVGRPGSLIPRVLTTAHLILARDTGDCDAYLGRPEVWEDLKSVHEAVLKADPDSVPERCHYVINAVACGRWQEAHRLLTALNGRWTPSVFRNRAHYEDLCKQVVEKVGKPLPK